MNPLEVAAAKHGTDKRQEIHAYTRTYHRHFEPIREKVKTVLELGVYEGASLLMWRDYFPNAAVHGIDLNLRPFKHRRAERVHVHRGSQTDPRLINGVTKLVGGTFDLAVDDGAHTNETQIASFKLIWPHVAPGGYYVMEDVCCNYWDTFNNSWPLKPDAPLQMLLGLVDDVNFRGHRIQIDGQPHVMRNPQRIIEDIQARGLHPDMDLSVEEITFANSTVILRKRGDL
jgi:hypothetical protein